MKTSFHFLVNWETHLPDQWTKSIALLNQLRQSVISIKSERKIDLYIVISQWNDCRYFCIHKYGDVCRALIEIYMMIVHHLSMMKTREVGLSRSLFSRSCSENFCHLFDIDDVDCLDEVYSMLLCRRIRLLLRRCIQKTAILTIILSASIYFFFSLSPCLLLLWRLLFLSSSISNAFIHPIIIKNLLLLASIWELSIWIYFPFLETYSPQVLIKVRLDNAVISKDYSLQCNSRGNPLPRLLWSKRSSEDNQTLRYYPQSKQCQTPCRIYSTQNK